MIKFVLTLLLIAIPAFSSKADQDTLEQKIQLLNYIASFSERVITERRNKVELQNLSDEIFDQIIPALVGDREREEFSSFQKSIEKFTLTTRQYDRAKIIAENQKAQALSQAIPNPEFLISTALSKPNPALIVTNIGAMLLSSAMSYKSAVDKAELENKQRNWELDDKDYSDLMELKTNAWKYMTIYANDMHLPKELTLSRDHIKDFFNYQKKLDLNKLISKLEYTDVKKIYTTAGFRLYYILLSDSYYTLADSLSKTKSSNQKEINELYRKSIKVFQDYEASTVPIFRKDFDAAKLLPKIILAAKECMPDTEYITFAKKYNDKLILESREADWDLRYYAALNYINFSGLERDSTKQHLQKAFNELLNNMTNLSISQDSLLMTYILPINENPPSKDTLKQDEFKDFLKIEKKLRKTALPTINKPFALNLSIAKSIANQDPELRKKWDKIIKDYDKSIVNVHLRKKLGLNYEKKYDITFDEDVLYVPVNLLDDETSLSMICTLDNGKEIKYNDIKYDIKEVKRPKEKNLNKQVGDSEFIGQMDNFKAKLKLSVNKFGIPFDDIQRTTIKLKNREGITLDLSFVKVNGDFIFKNIQ